MEASVRISNADIQKKMFDAIGISDEEANDKFGYLLEAFKYGVPTTCWTSIWI